MVVEYKAAVGSLIVNFLMWHEVATRAIDSSDSQRQLWSRETNMSTTNLPSDGTTITTSIYPPIPKELVCLGPLALGA